jgi:hypothetical protein
MEDWRLSDPQAYGALDHPAMLEVIAPMSGGS